MKWKFLFVKYNSERKKKINGYIRQALQQLILMNTPLWNQSQKDDLGVEELTNMNEQQPSSKHLH